MKCIATGSSGNTYALISDTNEILLLDLGASEKEIKVALDFNVAGIVGACVSHSHGDHSKSVRAIENMGIRVFEPYKHFTDHDVQIIDMKYGNYSVKAFALDDKNCKQWQHTNSDGSECPIYGFYINHPELAGAFIYVTDAKYIKWLFVKSKPSHILLGVDYQEDMLNKDFVKYNHQIQGHMSIETACNFVKANETNNLQNIFLGHLSNSNACSEDFIEEMKKVTRKDVYVVTEGFEKELSLPF